MNSIAAAVPDNGNCKIIICFFYCVQDWDCRCVCVHVLCTLNECGSTHTHI